MCSDIDSFGEGCGEWLYQVCTTLDAQVIDQLMMHALFNLWYDNVYYNFNMYYNNIYHGPFIIDAK